jgi:hypothetical protein
MIGASDPAIVSERGGPVPDGVGDQLPPGARDELARHAP